MAFSIVGRLGRGVLGIDALARETILPNSTAHTSGWEDSLDPFWPRCAKSTDDHRHH
jgi:hypothetical protein